MAQDAGAPTVGHILGEAEQLLAQGYASGAMTAFTDALAVDPHNVVAGNGIAAALQTLSRHTESLQVFRGLLHGVGPPLAWRIASNYLVGLHYAPHVTPVETLQATAELGSRFGVAQPLQPGTRNRPLRIGFVSADLADHPVGLLLLPLLAFLDRRRFTPVLYATGGRPDHTAAALRRFGEWHDVATLDHATLLARLRQDGIDILIDLSGHTAGNRLPVFARRAAPMQVSWLGYFGTTGVPAMDCVLMDSFTAPPGHEPLFTEEVLRMPHSRWCYLPVGFAPEVSAPPCVRSGNVTFGSFNNTAKYSEGLFAVWARILAAVPGSRLLLKSKTFVDRPYCDTIVGQFARQGVTRDRIEFRPQSVHRELLEQYADVDIALDPFPFSGGYTSCEALWMGLPVVTLAGDRAVSRQGLSLISSLGKAEWQRAWIACNEDDYVSKAVALAGDHRALADIRNSLRAVMKGSQLMDARRFAKDFEGVMLERWARLTAPEPLR